MFFLHYFECCTFSYSWRWSQFSVAMIEASLRYVLPLCSSCAEHSVARRACLEVSLPRSAHVGSPLQFRAVEWNRRKKRRKKRRGAGHTGRMFQICDISSEKQLKQATMAAVWWIICKIIGHCSAKRCFCHRLVFVFFVLICVVRWPALHKQSQSVCWECSKLQRH